MNRAAIEWARDSVLAGNPDALPPDTLTFLLRLYVAGDSLVRDHVEQGLTRGLALAGPASDPCSRMQGLRLLAEAAAVSDDDQLRPAVTRALRRSLARPTAVRWFTSTPAMASSWSPAHPTAPVSSNPTTAATTAATASRLDTDVPKLELRSQKSEVTPDVRVGSDVLTSQFHFSLLSSDF